MLRFLLTVVCLSFLTGVFSPLRAAEEPPAVERAKNVSVVVIPIRDEISDPTLFVLRRGIKEALANKVDVLVLDMDTLGGSAEVAFEMMEAILKFEGQSLTFVNKKAVSAGAFIAAATEEIWFAPRSVIGAAAAVTSQGQDIPETMRLKMNSFLRANIRAVSEGKGYRGEVVSAMIDKDYEFKIGDKVLKKPGELLSLTAQEAVAVYGTPPQPLLGAGLAKDLDALLTEKYGAGHYTFTELKVTWSEKVAQYLTRLSPILLGLGMLALFIEFKTPGFGFFGIAGIALLATVFLTSYVAGLSGHEPILVFSIGLILVIVELFFFPGVILPALLGVALMLGSLVWSLADLWPNEPLSISGGAFLQPLKDVGLGLVLAIGFALAILRFLPNAWFWDRMVLSSAVASAAQGSGVAPQEVTGMNALIGRNGVVITPLRPFGHIEIDGRRYEAGLTFGSAEIGAEVVVTGRTDFGLVVEKASV